MAKSAPPRSFVHVARFAQITRFAPAKINLYLHVTGRRDDGYHELDSLAVFADIGDVITVSAVEAGAGLSLDISGPFADALSPDDDNLVVRAARLLAAHTGVPADAHIQLEKNLPVASGIGGGSADAAATLKALVVLWDIELSDIAIHNVALDIADTIDTARALSTLFKVWRDDLGSDMLFTLGLQLGADVPVCLEGRPVYMGGIGERLELAPHLPLTWMVLVNPGVSVSTPAVFQARRDMAETQEHAFSAPARFHHHPLDAAHFARQLSERHNDLMAPAIALSPTIANVLSALESSEGVLLARMSGSGATCFALFGSESEAQAAAQTLAQAHPQWWVKAAQMLDEPLPM